jgi:hypothetical protein
MAEFIELTEYDGKKVLLNTEHILKIRPDDKGCYIYFDVATGSSNGSTSLTLLHVEESYSAIKRKLQQ